MNDFLKFERFNICSLILDGTVYCLISTSFSASSYRQDLSFMEKHLGL